MPRSWFEPAAIGGAAFHGHLDVLRVLLSRRAPLEAANVYGGTVLGLAVWAAVNRSDAVGIDYSLIVRVLLEGGARLDDKGQPRGQAGAGG